MEVWQTRCSPAAFRRGLLHSHGQDYTFHGQSRPRSQCPHDSHGGLLFITFRRNSDARKLAMDILKASSSVQFATSIPRYICDEGEMSKPGEPRSFSRTSLKLLVDKHVHARRPRKPVFKMSGRDSSCRSCALSFPDSSRRELRTYRTAIPAAPSCIVWTPRRANQPTPQAASKPVSALLCDSATLHFRYRSSFAVSVGFNAGART